LEEILGNQLIKTSLQNSILTSKIGHSYIFSGEKGCGKNLIATTFAKTLQCKAKSKAKTITPCLKCSSCIAFDSNNHPDIFYIKLKKTSTIGILEVKDSIISEVNIKPYNSYYKIFIIQDSNKLTPAAQNALLKTIEDPPPYCIFMFLTENFNQFLPTIISRCILHKIQPLGLSYVKKYLDINYNLEEERKNLILAYSNGSIGRAITLIDDNDFIELHNFFCDIPIKIQESDLSNLLFLAKKIEPFKERIQEGLDILYIYYRDMLIIKETKDTKYVLLQDKCKEIIYNSNHSSCKSLCLKLDAILNSKIKIQQYSNFQLTIEMLLLQLKEN
jgi:DNA polymerase III subunit delta'